MNLNNNFEFKPAKPAVLNNNFDFSTIKSVREANGINTKHPWNYKGHSFVTKAIEGAKELGRKTVNVILGNMPLVNKTADAVDKLSFERLIADVSNRVMEKIAIIKSEDGQFALYSRDGQRKLGTHETYEKALAQEKAIQANKHKHKEY